MIDTLVLDLGGVAARFRPEQRLESLAALSGVAKKTIQEQIFDSGFDHRAEVGDYSFDEVMTALKDALEYRESDVAVIESWAQAFEPDRAILEHVRSLPVRKALFTNNGPMLDACLAGPLIALRDAFDEIICSWHLGACKPDALAFERAATRLGALPEQLLLLDDSQGNIDAALRYGWDAQLVSDLDGVITAFERRLSPGIHKSSEDSPG